MSNAETKAASLLGPVATTFTATANSLVGLRGCGRYATSTANASATLPTQTLDDGRVLSPLQGKFLRICNEHATADLDIGFGIGAAPTLVSKQVANFPAGHVSAGIPISAKSFIDVIVPLGATHLSFILEAAAAASTVALYCSEGNVDTVK